MSSICPTVLAATKEEYREQMDAIIPFADRIQIDIGDGKFTTKSVGVDDISIPENLTADIHVMFQEPGKYTSQLIALQPHMVIVHAEASGDIAAVLKTIHSHGVKTGIAILQTTQVSEIARFIDLVDHVLIFSGSLGSFGGNADLSLLAKVAQIRALKPNIEIGWDGGANIENARQLRDGGIDVINVGSAVQKAIHPANAYRMLLREIEF